MTSPFHRFAASIVFGGVALALAVAAILSPAIAQPKMISDDLKAWQSTRQAEFAQWTAAHPNVEAQIADLNAKTAALRSGGAGPRYGDLIDRSRRLSKAEKQEALVYFKNGFELWQAGDFVSAEIGFKRGLEIDPANGMANFYYGDCLQRRGDIDSAREYFSRAVTLGQGSAEALKAEAALRMLSQGDGEVARPAVIWQVAGAIREVWDCAECPKITIVPAGEFSMGTPKSDSAGFSDERPVRRVTVPSAIGVGTYEVTRAEYGVFAAQTAREWLDPGFAQTLDHPAVVVSWDDAKAYVAWLSQKTGKTYRLLSEAEWEYAARAGTTSAYPWGETASHEYANYGKDDNSGGLAQGRDQWVNTSPGGAFPSNRFGLYDMHGNAWEWTEDCWNDNYNGAPSDSRARTTGDCTSRVLRGGSRNNLPRILRSAYRLWLISSVRDLSVGFRVSRTN